MAYIAPDKLRSDMPGGGVATSDLEAETYIIRWTHRLEFEPTTERETSLAEAIVETGAGGNLLRLILRRSLRPTTEADTMIKEATDMLSVYNAMRTTEGEDTGLAAFVSEVSW